MIQSNDSFFDEVLIQAIKAKNELLEIKYDASDNNSRSPSAKNASSSVQVGRRMSMFSPSAHIPPTYLLLKKVFQNSLFLSNITNYLEDNEKLWFDLFLRDFYEIFTKLAIISSAQKNYNEHDLLKESQKNDILKRYVSDYHSERSMFIDNIIKTRRLQNQAKNYRRKYIEDILWRNEPLFGERLRQEFWSERMEIASKLSSGYRGNIHQYLQTCKNLREKYQGLRDNAMDQLHESKSIRNEMLQEVESSTFRMLSDIYSQAPGFLIALDKTLLNSVHFALDSASSQKTDILDQKVIANKIHMIKMKFEEDINAVMKHHDRWKANHVRRVLKDTSKISKPANGQTNRLESGDAVDGANGNGSYDEKLMEYQITSTSESKEFVKHIVDVLERCVNTVNKNSEKKAAMMKTMIAEIKAPATVSDLEKLKRTHFQNIEKRFNTRLASKIGFLTELQESSIVKRKESLQEARLEFENMQKLYMLDEANYFDDKGLQAQTRAALGGIRRYKTIMLDASHTAPSRKHRKIQTLLPQLTISMLIQESFEEVLNPRCFFRCCDSLALQPRSIGEYKLYGPLVYFSYRLALIVRELESIIQKSNKMDEELCTVPLDS